MTYLFVTRGKQEESLHRTSLLAKALQFSDLINASKEIKIEKHDKQENYNKEKQRRKEGRKERVIDG